MTTVRTVGHGTLSAEEFASLLDLAHVDLVVDVRSFPGSRHNPQFGRREMEQWVPKAEIGYIRIRELGGRRRPVAGSKHVALRNDAFRAYADYMETHAFLTGIEELLVFAKTDSPSVMCGESLWWRCHRRLMDVVHLTHDGRSTPHIPTEGVRLTDDGLVYDVGVTPRLSIT
jgi:uncharacterized protein (DUF488 family)